ncbi:hypothetical protein COLO4_35721 [Corchorus olitorius]|uniref:F-box domain-containing protein n=1 Tax=Corchorus olitorius TaxID=93759 RepID=A0A1R3GDS8_9ROSI|nr:hypothetical protein COLO4_35721 [Corchorus olitorius]
MEFGSLVPKIPKLLKDSSVDNISRLPDEILSHIFSFLSTVEVVRTSILSKRWKHVWSLAPNLDFNDHFGFSPVDEAKFRLFKDYVDNVLFHHGGLDIKKFCLQCATSPHIYAWISAVLSCNVEELTIKSSFIDTCKELPWNLFTCKTLVSLRIDGGFILNLPYYVCFPCLKKLHLDSLIYVDDSSMQRLFSSCLVLEELYLRRARGDCVVIANIMIPSLKRLYLFVPTLELLANHDYKTNINAPYLELLQISDSASKNYSVNFSVSLVEAQILGRCPFLLEGISNVQVLKLSGETMENWHSLNSKWPTFHNLFHLELGLSHLDGWKLLSHLLNSSPNLETLGLVEPIGYGGYSYGFYWIPPDSVPVCLLECLESIEIHNFADRRCEIFLVKYMLLHAEVLEELTIHWRSDIKCSKKTELVSSIQQEILNIPRRSEGCEIKFI